jgi:hypothetical protein
MYSLYMLPAYIENTCVCVCVCVCLVCVCFCACVCVLPIQRPFFFFKKKGPYQVHSIKCRYIEFSEILTAISSSTYRPSPKRGGGNEKNVFLPPLAIARTAHREKGGKTEKILLTAISSSTYRPRKKEGKTEKRISHRHEQQHVPPIEGGGNLTQILKSQCPSTFSVSIQSKCTENL